MQTGASALRPAVGGGQTIAAMQARIDAALGGLLNATAPVALLGLADDSDVGDSARLLGELCWLRQHGGAPQFVSPIGPQNWLRMERRVATGAIALHGGSFGDRDPARHAMAEAVLWRYRGRSVVQFSATMRFSSPGAIDQTARVIERHGAFTLLVRDGRSFDLARRSFACDVRLCPDMTFAMGPLARGKAGHAAMLLLQDGRRAGADEDVRMIDWTAVTQAKARDVTARGRRALVTALVSGVSSARVAMSRVRAETRLEHGLTLLRAAGFVITDRLDVHSLCVLLGVPQCLVDDGDGGIADYRTTWPNDGPDVAMVGSVEEALILYRQVAAERERAF